MYPWIQLYGPEGKRLAATPTSGGSRAAWLDNVLLTQDGLHTIVVSSRLALKGTYSVSLALCPGPVCSSSEPNCGDILPGGSVAERIDPAGDADVYRFWGFAGQGVVITMRGNESPYLQPCIRLYGPDGWRVASSPYGDTQTMVEDIQLPATGVYMIVASSSDGRTGSYGLSISLAPPREPNCATGPSPKDGQAVPCGIRTLAWQPVAGATGYDVYLAAGACSPLERIAENVPVASVNVGSITAEGVYFWQVVAHGPEGEVKGPVWWFAVEPCEGCRLEMSTVGNGTVSADPPGPTYACGQQVRVVATPGAGYRLVRWQGSAIDAGKVVIGGLEAVVTVDGNYTLEAVFEPEQAVLQVLYDFPLDSNPGWVMDGQWEFGRPLGQGGQQYGTPDPSRGRTGQNVIGVNLAGDYDVRPGGPYCVIAGPFDLSAVSGARLRYFRWLNTDEPAYVRSTVEVSVQGMGGRVQWVPIWEHSQRSPIMDKSWVQEDLDLGLADGCKDVYIRWLYQVNPGAYPYSGWNIDDIQLVGYIGGQ